jgi:transcriptional regulator with XRE-family HTH domain
LAGPFKDKAMKPIERAIRQAIQAKKVTRYRVAADSGVDYAALSRFLAGKASLKLESIELLAEYLDLELRPKATKRKSSK